MEGPNLHCIWLLCSVGAQGLQWRHVRQHTWFQQVRCRRRLHRASEAMGAGMWQPLHQLRCDHRVSRTRPWW
jgi:hypothetical protein